MWALLYPDRQHQKADGCSGVMLDCTVIIFTAVMQMAGLLSNMLWLFVFCSNVQGDSQTSICITIEPGLLLKGDILVRMGEILGYIHTYTFSF